MTTDWIAIVFRIGSRSGVYQWPREVGQKRLNDFGLVTRVFLFSPLRAKRTLRRFLDAFSIVSTSFFPSTCVLGAERKARRHLEF